MKEGIFMSDLTDFISKTSEQHIKTILENKSEAFQLSFALIFAETQNNGTHSEYTDIGDSFKHTYMVISEILRAEKAQ